ncbi:MAG TPA: hypothetical protein VLL97_09105, partial [Acidobacteriota bacterium]|nr:hypothetical protein [Acidobacteriota bacterium]
MKNVTSNSMYKPAILIISILMVCGCTAVKDDRPDSGAIQYLQGPKNAEDFLPLGDTQWLVTSGLNGEASNMDHNGHIYLVNRKEKTFDELFPGATPQFEHDKEMFNACPGPLNPDDFSAHGLDLQQQSSGLYRLYVINHGEREAIEIFTIDAKGTKPAIRWVGCVLLPDVVMANSVAILPGGGFLTTNYFDPTKPNSIGEL